ncbi:hypothetical protein [Nitrospira sp. M1]
MRNTVDTKRDLRFVAPEDMTLFEKAKWERSLKASLESGTEEAERFFAKRREHKQGVGLNPAGEIICEKNQP